MLSDSDNSHSCYVLKEQECHVIGMARGITGLVAVLLSLLALGLILLLRVYKNYTHRLFLYLTLATMFHTPTYILEVMSIDCEANSTVPREYWCSVTGPLVVYISWVQNLVVLWITGYLFRIIVLRIFINTSKVEISIILLFLLFPIVPALIPLINKKYGVFGAWCWIVSCTGDTPPYRMDMEGLGYQLGLWYIPFVLEMIVILVMTVCILIVLYNRSYRRTIYVDFQSEYRRMMKESLPLLIFPILFCIISIFEMVVDLLRMKREGVMFNLLMLDAVVSPFKANLMIVGYLALILWSKHKVWSRKRALSLRQDEWEEIQPESTVFMDRGRGRMGYGTTAQDTPSITTTPITSLSSKNE